MAELKKRKVPERRCLGCNVSKPKSELIRVVRAPDGTVSLDFKGKKSGRGAYVCRDRKCLEKAVKSKRISKNLECEIPEEVMKMLFEEIESGEADYE